MHKCKAISAGLHVLSFFGASVSTVGHSLHTTFRVDARLFIPPGDESLVAARNHDLQGAGFLVHHKGVLVYVPELTATWISVRFG